MMNGETRVLIGLLAGLLVATCVLLLMSGCARPNGMQVTPTITVESEGPVEVDATTEAEQFDGASAKVKKVEGDLAVIGNALDEVRADLEKYRIGQQFKMMAAVFMTSTGVILGFALALGANDLFTGWWMGATKVAGFVLAIVAVPAPWLLLGLF